MKINHSFQINSLLKMICDRFLIFTWSVAETTTLDREWINTVMTFYRPIGLLVACKAVSLHFHNLAIAIFIG
jgi:hypothetical protein